MRGVQPRPLDEQLEREVQRDELRHEPGRLGKLRRLRRLLRHDGDADEDGDSLHVWSWDVQRVEQHHGDAGVHASGAQHELCGSELRAVERVHL